MTTIAAYSQTQRNYILEGKNQDNLLSKRIKKAAGIVKLKVEAKKHTVISGPPGVGKSYTTFREVKESGKPFVMIGAGASDAAVMSKIAYNVKKYCINKKQELILLYDDADDVIFKDKSSMNTWKIAMGKNNPVYSRDIDLSSTIVKLRKQSKDEIADAIEFFQEEGEVGITIPFDKVRIIVLCNKNYEDPKQVYHSKRDDVEALLDRVKYTRLDFEWKVSWGWLAYILQSSQPFEEDGFKLTKAQKSYICKWMWDKWETMRNCSYRTIEEMAEHMINDPDDFEDEWETFLAKGGKK